MSAPTAQPKRHRRSDGRVEGRRSTRDPDSSQDASEEDNDVSDVASSINAPSLTPSVASSPRLNAPSSGNGPTSASRGSVPLPPLPLPLGVALNPLLRRKDAKEWSDEGLESPTYDGDIESSSTIGTPIHTNHASNHQRRSSSPSPQGPSTTSPGYPLGRAPTPKASRAKLVPEIPPPLGNHAADVPVAESESLSNPYRHHEQKSTGNKAVSAAGPRRMYTRPVELSEDNIRSFVQRAIDGRGEEDGVDRWWKTSPPPKDRPVRIYADGVYDLFHFGHALQLRQAKLSFDNVHLIVGVCSDALCAGHKSAPAMTHAERCEAVRHCRWADEVFPDAPWVVDQDFIDKYEIDYIAHDELVYPSKDMEDVYTFAKGQGKFLPTRRTPSISTSDLLERIVRGYRDGFFDSKLEKNGQIELLAADVDWDSDKSVERRQRRAAAAKKSSKA
ncbi:choline-phosphate cytidylyltransferase [Vanrija albida]|uniref:choline-phosphate cytidylyltransferase n=1 Tax=Vanrija albida TaxID=181172 RepID=A0ABR3PXF3_9TREE